MKRLALLCALIVLVSCRGARTVNADPPNPANPSNPTNTANPLNPAHALGGIVNPANIANPPAVAGPTAPDPAPELARLGERAAAAEKALADLRAKVEAGTVAPEVLRQAEASKAVADEATKVAKDSAARLAEIEKVAKDALDKANRPFPVTVGPAGLQGPPGKDGEPGKPIDPTLPGIGAAVLAVIAYLNDRRTAKKAVAEVDKARLETLEKIAEAFRRWEALPENASDADVREALGAVKAASAK